MSDKKEILLPDPSKLVVSSSPHLHASSSVNRVMYDVVIAMLPACILSVVYFGWPALNVLLLCSIFCVGLEWLTLKVLKRDTKAAFDGSALITGILLGMNLAANAPWWICFIGAILAIVLAKQLYGGLGYNPFNPALVARVGLLIAFPSAMTKWPINQYSEQAINKVQAALEKGLPVPDLTLDAFCQATPLYNVKNALDAMTSATWATGSSEVTYDYMSYFLGTTGGCIGEVSALAILIGGLYLLYRGLIRWQVPFFYLLTVYLFASLLHLIGPEVSFIGNQAPPLFHLLTGGVMLGAFFMATDMVTSPVTKKGTVIYAVGCGVITMLIRIWGAYPEGVSFSILFMNAFVPLIDRVTSKTAFGNDLSLERGEA